MSFAALPSGLYAITPDMEDTACLVNMVTAAIAGGASTVQYRNKSASPKLRNIQAQALLAVCRQAAVPLIINDDVKLCLALDADGVHIGKTDADMVATRQRIGNSKLLGVSCYNQFGLAQQAQAAGANYVAFGACFASQTKPLAVQAELSLFQQAKQAQMLAVAIGGIHLQNVTQLKQAGAHAVAVIHALFGSQQAAQIQQQAQQFCLLLN